jgi:hypothetical protein
MDDAQWHATVVRFAARVESAAAELARVAPADAAQRPAPGKWSRKEIVGHLIDSASNNHQRFVRARFRDDLVFPGYDQDAWVAVQRWQDEDWSLLVRLWRDFNLHLAHVLSATPREVRDALHERHAFDRIAFKPHRADEPATLGWFMLDYVDHLEHHLRQAGVSAGSSA